MEQIVVGFSRPKKWKPFAALIMFLYDIPYDHVYIKFDSTTYDRKIIYQASKLAVNFMGQNLFKQDNVIVDEFTVDITSDNKIKLMQFCIDKAGYPYGIKKAVGMGIVRLFDLFGRKISNPFDNKNTYVCSQLAGFILEQFAGARLPDSIDNINPKEVYVYLRSVRNGQN